MWIVPATLMTARPSGIAMLAVAVTILLADHALADSQVLATEPGGMVTLEVGNALSVARVDREGLLAPDVKLRQSGSRFHGRVGLQKLAVVFEENRLTGTIGERPVSLIAVRMGDALSINGNFGVREIALTLSIRALEGQVGACRYRLAFQRRAYRGWVGCGGPPEAVRLAIPATLGARKDVEIAALLTPLLLQ